MRHWFNDDRVQNDWNRTGQRGLVVGATFPEEIARVRAVAPRVPLLVPGVGARGGDAAATVRAAFSQGPAPLMVNSSRAVLYASAGDDFAQAARRVAQASHQDLKLPA
jgi:orotidine-5'-phosphate decarboxylase